ncbi:MAG: hypothetical protein ACRD8Z_06270 [Nitrososphaeraceae archaeon]
MMTAKARSRLPSTKLNMLLTEINSTLGHAKELILKAYNLAIQENYSPQQAKQLLLDNITEFKKTQIYAYLPSECKDPVKQKAGYLSHKTELSVPEPEQNTETAIESDCNEQYSNDSLPQYTKNQVTELREKKLPKIYYKSLPLIGVFRFKCMSIQTMMSAI